MSEQSELRYATYLDGTIVLDEVVGEGVFHMEDMTGASWAFGGPGFLINVYIDWLPRGMWWEEIKEAWWCRRLPCFRVIRLQVIEADHVRAKLDGRHLSDLQREMISGVTA